MTATTRMSFLGPITTHVFNPVTRLVAGLLPGFGMVRQRGRTSGRSYRTPLLVQRQEGDYVFALWYGSDAQWVKNVLAAGGCELQTRGSRIRLVEPRLFVDNARLALPLPLRWAGSAVGLSEFLRLRVAAASG